MKTKATPKTTQLGFCHDCAQGSLLKGPGFELYIDDDGNESHWFCRHCSSNHVSLYDDEGNTVYEEGDLYEV